MSTPAATAYDEVPYPGNPFEQTHPDRLATIATLLGMTPAPVTQCRVLEIGCGDGGNLLPMAYNLPESQLLGLDNAPSAIAKGRAALQTLGLGNLRLECQDLRRFSAEAAAFDYIIAHGVYSWVTPDVQDRLLAVCRESLAPTGVAYVSYNCYPGGHVPQMVREMMLFHTRNIAGPAERVAQSQVLLRFILQVENAEDPYRQMAAKELERLRHAADGVLFHDHLAEHNSPLYFHEFAERAARHGLQFLSEADYFETQYEVYGPELAGILAGMEERDVVLKEQYLDFLKCRRFRQTLLCRAGIPLNRRPEAEAVVSLQVSSNARPDEDAARPPSGGQLTFRTPTGSKLVTDHRLTQAALVHLASVWPRSVPFPELLSSARERMGGSAADGGLDPDALAMAEILLRGYSVGSLGLHTWGPPCVSHPGERPRTSRLARWQLQTNTTVTNLRHVPVAVQDPLARHLLQVLDGTRDRQAIIAELKPLLEGGLATLAADGQRVTDPRQAVRVLEEQLEAKLNEVARLALLEA